jgi:hypothetical protein
MNATFNKARAKWFLLALFSIALPFLVVDTTNRARYTYLAILLVLTILSTISHLIGGPNLDARPLTKSHFGKWLPIVGWITNFFFIVIQVLVANLQIFGTVALDFARLIIEKFKPLIPLLADYEFSFRYGRSESYSPTFEELDLLKVQTSTLAVLVFGCFLSVVFLIQHFRKNSIQRAAEYWSRAKRKTPSFFLLIGGIILAVVVPIYVWIGSIDLDTTPSRRVICIMNFYCYGDDSFLILLAALMKLFIAFGFPLGAIIMVDRKLLEVKDYPLDRV